MYSLNCRDLGVFQAMASLDASDGADAGLRLIKFGEVHGRTLHREPSNAEAAEILGTCGETRGYLCRWQRPATRSDRLDVLDARLPRALRHRLDDRHGRALGHHLNSAASAGAQPLLDAQCAWRRCWVWHLGSWRLDCLPYRGRRMANDWLGICGSHERVLAFPSSPSAPGGTPATCDVDTSSAPGARGSRCGPTSTGSSRSTGS